jgi:hypothetical protein
MGDVMVSKLNSQISKCFISAFFFTLLMVTAYDAKADALCRRGPGNQAAVHTGALEAGSQMDWEVAQGYAQYHLREVENMQTEVDYWREKLQAGDDADGSHRRNFELYSAYLACHQSAASGYAASLLRRSP